MFSRFAVATIGGLAVSYSAWNAIAKKQEEAYVDFRHSSIFKRFMKFASVTVPPPPSESVNSTSSSSSSSAVAAASTTSSLDLLDEHAMTIEDFIAALTSAGRGDAKKEVGENNAAIFQDEKVKSLIQELVTLVDNDGNGFIDFHEYATLQTLLAIPIKTLRGALEMFDKPNQNRITLPQFKALLRAMSAGRLGSNAIVGGDDPAKLLSETHQRNLGDGTTSLARFFFGDHGTQTVTFGEFLGRLSEIRNLVRGIEFHCALAGSKHSNTAETRASISSVRQRLIGSPISQIDLDDAAAAAAAAASSATSAAGSVSSQKKEEMQFSEASPLVKLDDYRVFMALLALSEEWSRGLKLFLDSKDDNVITHKMLSRVLEGVDLSALVTSETDGVISRNPTSVETSHIRIYASKQQAEMFCQLMDQNHDGTIDVAEVAKIAKSHGSFFAAFVPQFHTAPRSIVQQFAHCMQQKQK